MRPVSAVPLTALIVQAKRTDLLKRMLIAVHDQAANLFPYAQQRTGLSKAKALRAFVYRYHQPVFQLLFALILQNIQLIEAGVCTR